MIRSQIYLTQYEKKSLETMAKTSGKKQSELIRIAIDNLISAVRERKKKDIFDELSGIWADRDASLNAKTLRQSWDREL